MLDVSQSLSFSLGDTHLAEKRDTILVASWDPILAVVRRQILETAGYEVVSAKGSRGVRTLCKKKHVNLVVIGYSMPPAEKRRIWVEAREVCKAPILELHRGGKPELIESHAFAHESQVPDDFVKAVKSVLDRYRN